jgi:hypothetical protein
MQVTLNQIRTSEQQGRCRGFAGELAQRTAIRAYVSGPMLRCLRRSSFVWLMDRGGSAAMLVIEMRDRNPDSNSGLKEKGVII